MEKFLSDKERLLVESIKKQWPEWKEKCKKAIREATAQGKIQILKISKEGEEKVIL